MEVPSNIMSTVSFREKFESKLSEFERQHQGSQKKPWTADKILEVMNHIRKAREGSKQPKTSMDYYWSSKYDIMEIANEETLVFKKKSPNHPTVCIIPSNEYFVILEEVHKRCGHGGRDKMIQAIKSKFYIPKKAIEIFLALCPTCGTKKHLPKKGIVTRPIAPQGFNMRGQVELMDFRSYPDGEFKWLLNYQDNATKFISLRPLKTRRAQEVAAELLKIFLTFGAPYILQSDNGREFTAKIVEELNVLWPECNIIHRSPRKTPKVPQGSVKRIQDVENMLRSWMYDNNSTNWALGCYHVQYKKNTSIHRVIKKSPYKAMFGSEPKTCSSVLIDIEPENVVALHANEQNIKLDQNNESDEHLNRSILDQAESESD